MSYYKKFFSVIILLISVYITACCGCGSNIDGDNTLKGVIEIIGNEPFTKLALRTSDDNAYLLQCSKELKDMLWKHQGEHYYIKYGDMRKVEGYNTIIVEKVIPITKESN